ncbi:MAG: hypothetical protein NZ898_12660 [Myxococcota bacterium]|nr:hypothetical protein [Myxococcota bacterium]MDW8361812.1 hypothetical protein [Myxococcales bacterium]
MSGPDARLLARVERFVRDLLVGASRRPVRVGVSGPQGAGKSTLVAALVERLEATGHRAVGLSIDDLYLTHEEQRALAAAHPGNRYLEHRGYPGTHDVELGARLLDALCARHPAEVRVPVYDKGAHGGRGDRMPETSWRVVRTPLDVVLLDGWMLGFVPVSSSQLVDAHLAVANERLVHYEAWHRRLDALVHLDAVDPTSVVRWRVQAERARRDATGAGLSDEEARDYVERFLPAYALWVPGLRARAPVDGPVLRLRIDEDRGLADDPPDSTPAAR